MMRQRDNRLGNEDFLAEARRVIADLPPHFRDQLAQVVVSVEDFATAEQLASVGLADKWHLSGLYHGRPLPDQTIWYTADMPPEIFLFRRPLLAEAQSTGVELADLIRHVVIHEAGHHFGFSDDDMHRLEDGA